MDELLLIARCALALVFAIAAVGKLADLGSFRSTLEAFGARSGFVQPAAIAIPIAELATAALLLPTPTVRAGAIAAAALLGIFCIAIARLLLHGETPDCGCFGALKPQPVSATTLVRNLGLTLVAGLVAVGGPGGTDASPVAIAIAAAFAIQAWFSWQLFRQHGRLIERVRALENRAKAAPTPTTLTVVHRRRLQRDSLERRIGALER